MSVAYQVRHETAYRYEDPVIQSHHEARLLPRSLPWQTVGQEQFTVSPIADQQRERIDAFGNRVVHYALQHPHSLSQTVSAFEVQLHPERRPDVAASSTRWKSLQDVLDPQTRPWIYASPRVPLMQELADYAREPLAAHDGLLEGCRALMQRMHGDFTFDADSTEVTTGVDEAFAARRGVCQDFAHIMIGALRALHIPARYISGYLETLPPPGQKKLAGADASHAWVSVYDPAIGWVDFDPTNNLLPRDQHITLGWGRDFSDVPPLKGVVIGGSKQQLEVKVDVLRMG